jgi:hypothetical protein
VTEVLILPALAFIVGLPFAVVFVVVLDRWDRKH